MRVLLAGGGTAGHTSPLLATADALTRLAPDAEVTCLGTPRGLETRVVPEAGYPLELIPPVPLPRSVSADLLRVPGRLRAAVRETLAVVDRVRPDVVVGYGGYVSVPAYLAARRRGVPVVVHEQNALPGLGNRLGARVAARVAVSFPDTPLPRAEFVGLPIRRMISTLDRGALRAEALAGFGAHLSAMSLAGAPSEQDYAYYPQRWREPYLARRRKVGWDLYSALGIRKGDREATARQHARNYAFFDAPVGMIFTMDRDLEIGSWLDMGMFLQNVMIAARAWGLETCPQAAFANYAQTVARLLDIPADRQVIVGMALGHPDPGAPEYRFQTDREPVSSFTRFVTTLPHPPGGARPQGGGPPTA